MQSYAIFSTMAKEINGIDFGPIWGMSGLFNFYGQGWPYHKILRLFGINFKGITLVSKTVTLLPRLGNMPLNKNLMPSQLIPKSVYVNLFRKHALNAVSLSGPGAEVILSSRELHEKTEPFQLSFMSVAATAEERLKEFDQFIKILLREYPNYRAPIGLQLNITCPNTEHDNPEREEILKMLNMCGALAASGIAIILKISVEMPVENVLIFGRHPNCHAICTSNTVQFGKLPEKINWQKLFPHGSPILRRNLSVPSAGGLSGAPLLPLVIEQVKELRKAGFEKHINAGGGVLYARDVDALYTCGADSVAVGSAYLLNPFAVPSIIKRAYELF
jgi:dihydroorotate dehydrogenase